jgi:predicted transcriptional regulator
MDVLDTERRESRRSNVEIACDILSALSDGTSKPTHIAYRANLSWTLVNRFLEVMVERKLVSKLEMGRRSSYSLTASGRDVLAQFNKVKVGLAIPEDMPKLTHGAQGTQSAPTSL